MAKEVTLSTSKLILNDHERAQKRQLEIEETRRIQMKIYQLDPMAWLEERFGEDPKNFKWSDRPAYEFHEWDGDKDPLYEAWMAIAGGNWAGIEAATGTSKTFLFSRVVFWFLDVFQDSLVVTTAPKQAQLQLHLWAEITKAYHKFKKIRPKAALYNLRLVVEEEEINKRNSDNWEDASLSKSWQAVGFVSGVGSTEESATKAQGFHREKMLIITEETPGMPFAVLKAFKNTCSDRRNNLILAGGNPDNQLDVLHDFCTSGTAKHFRISGYDYPNVVEKKNVIPGAITQSFIDAMAIENGVKSNMYRSRVRGISPSESAESLIKLDWVRDAFKRDLQYDGSFHAVGVDVANSVSGDKACFAWGMGQILKEVHAFACENATHLAYNLFMDSDELQEKGYTDYGTSTLADYDVMDGFIAVDAVGVGVATINALTDSKYDPIAIQGGQWNEAIPEDIHMDETTNKEKVGPKYKFQSLRAQCYWELREDLRHGAICFKLKDDKKLQDDIALELTTPKVTYRGNFIIVEGKDEIKKRLGGKSPNMADAIAYWNWARKGYRISSGSLPMMGL